MISSQNLKIHKVENFTLKSGINLSLELSYLTLGELNENKDNVIVYPTRYAGTHLEQDYLIGEQLALNSKEYFIIIRSSLVPQQPTRTSHTTSVPHRLVLFLDEVYRVSQ